MHPTHIRPTLNPTILHPFFCDHCEEAARGEDCAAAHGEGDEATEEGLKPLEKEMNRIRRMQILNMSSTYVKKDRNN